MKRYIKSSYSFSTSIYDDREKSVGFEVERNDGVDIHEKVFFPKSKIVYSIHDGIITVEIPDWLYKQKVSSGFRCKRY